MHRRKSSQSDDENIFIPVPGPSEPFPNHSSSAPESSSTPPSTRSRVNSTPTQPLSIPQNPVPGPPPSAGPYKTSFNVPPRPTHTTSPYRTSFSGPNGLGVNGHSRNRTVSSPYSPSQSSPLAFTFPQSAKQSLGPPPMSTSASAPEAVNSQSTTAPSPPQHSHNRRHSRMHSRNLSIFFPRPGSLPQSTIAEDGSQEIQIGADDVESALPIPSADSTVSVPGRRRPMSTHGPVTPLGAGFTFGGKPPPVMGAPNPVPPPMSAGGSSNSRSRRGHHHKNSLSHNFFSFMEPGANGPPTPVEELHTQPTPMPVSPWNPISPFPVTPASATHSTGVVNGNATQQYPNNKREVEEEPQEVFGALGWAICQFSLGGWMWISGQQNGSLSTTGLGYWVVFHALGVTVAHVLPSRWKTGGKDKLRRSYGDARIETVFMFAQAVYLMFAAVYICKETVEHLLLSAGGNHGDGGHEGHHHHHGDGSGGSGVEFPLLLLFLSLLSIVVSSFFYSTHGKLVELAGNRIPSPDKIIRSIYSSSNRNFHDAPPTTTMGILLSNPYVTSPLVFSLAIFFLALLTPPSNQVTCDLVVAGFIAFVTFRLAYDASVVLGTVLLQTAPPRGLSGGKMEAFLRVMREIERHPNVLHLPPPHIWQLAPTPPNPSRFETSSLVTTLELHVGKELNDDDVLALTKWAWERCSGALGVRGGHDEGGKVDVTVGIVRG